NRSMLDAMSRTVTTSQPTRVVATRGPLPSFMVTPRDALHPVAAGRPMYTSRTSLACRTSRTSPRLSPAGRVGSRGEPGLATATRGVDPGSARQRRKAPTGWSEPFGDLKLCGRPHGFLVALRLVLRCRLLLLRSGHRD